MFHSRDTPPPPLSHSSSLSEQSTTPSTVTTASVSPPEQPQPHSHSHPWFQRQKTSSAGTRLSLIDPDFDENTFPTFGATPTEESMAVETATNDSFTLRQTSTSPRGNQPSGLTAALKSESASNPTTQTPRMEPPRPSLAVPESSDMSKLENGSRPISVKRPNTFNRRESLAQSVGMGLGMSWGGVSVGSWVRDE